ncbi:hypothetical protein VNO77_20200 [Canavalia gladiata]|uniref:Uncharacterized protein n=1 Tax=Canavalia gladiata TaxID=3824 RepID=A0AAN9QQB8_CANGL
MELMDPAAEMVDKAVVVLANLVIIPQREDTNWLGDEIHLMVQVIELDSARGKENATITLLHMTFGRDTGDDVKVQHLEMD